MIPIPSGVMIWIASGQVDMRKGMAGLSLLIQEHFNAIPSPAMSTFSEAGADP